MTQQGASLASLFKVAGAAVEQQCTQTHHPTKSQIDIDVSLPTVGMFVDVSQKDAALI